MNSKSLLFNIDISTGLPPAEGRLLISEPFLRESYFNHAVIVLVDHEAGISSMGVVVNNLSDYTLQQLIDGVTIEAPVPVYTGGPVGSDRLFFLHTLGDLIPESRQIAPGLYVGGDFDSALTIVNDGYELEGHLRFFLGYSGWNGGQLEDELEKSVWAVAPLGDPADLLTGDDDAVWHREVRALGPKYRGWLYHPQNISAN